MDDASAGTAAPKWSCELNGPSDVLEAKRGAALVCRAMAMGAAAAFDVGLAASELAACLLADAPGRYRVTIDQVESHNRVALELRAEGPLPERPESLAQLRRGLAPLEALMQDLSLTATPTRVVIRAVRRLPRA